jgi:PAP2 superfamily
MLYIFLVPSCLLVGSAVASIFDMRDRRWNVLFLISLAWFPVAAFLVSGLSSMSRSDVRYDEFFLVTERFFGYPSFYLGRLLNALPMVKAVVAFDYFMFISFAFCAVAALFALEGTRSGLRAWLAMLLNPFLAGFLYKLLPASGPTFAFPAFPATVPTLAVPHVLHFTAPPNCFPSAHLSAALLVLFFLRDWRAGRILGFAHVILTILATLGLGEHYFIDLLASVPYTACILYLSDLAFRRSKAAPIRLTAVCTTNGMD